MTKPITPSEVAKVKSEQIPDSVIETWNRLISENWKGSYATISLKEAVKALGGTGPNNLWVNIEDVYRAVGWNVMFDQPGYNESYEATYKFSKGRRKTD